MRSGLVPCSVMHCRVLPTRHQFTYSIFLVSLDLDDIPTLTRRWGVFNANGPGLFSIRERDYLPLHEVPHPRADSQVRSAATSTLRDRVTDFLAAQGVALEPTGRIVVVTMPRIAGHAFNPVTFYFCWHAEGRPAGAIAEVTNTFREMKPFWVPPDANSRFRIRVPKHFYVSPFSDVDVSFDFNLSFANGRLDVQIDDFTGDTRTLTSTLRGDEVPLTTARLAWFALKYPMLTVRVLARIHWHALRLYLKGVPWFAKAARASEQRGLFRPHSLPPTA